jgi:hypothetical protein
VDPSNPAYLSVAGVLFNKGQTSLIEYPAGAAATSYTIPNSTTCIADSAFAYSDTLTNVTIPVSVTNIGDEAFENCFSLTTVTIPNRVTSIGNHVFDGCYDLTSVTIPDGVTSIGEYAFSECFSLTSITIPNSVTNLAIGSFDQCGLTSVTIGRGVSSIGDAAFADCGYLTSILFTGNPPAAAEGVFGLDYGVTAYYLAGTTGWGSFSVNTGLPVVLWNPLIQASGPGFGVHGNQFGFDILGTTSIAVVVEACTNLANPVWTPLQRLSLTNGVVHFSDPQWTPYTSRFYSLGFP